ncbi:hypothetical protein CRE_25832 [Caenorhabditis remanei]|uniref:Uncharacterized protein n=1 Tax=Caenorhabditis remanei TaxID=31234 RepID=E3NA83_CAERE|nr:hypothetical protein CRE_25832 [Caenorhabditis remanei]
MNFQRELISFALKEFVFRKCSDGEEKYSVRAKGFTLFYHDGHYDHFHPTVENVQARFCFRCHKVVGANHARTCETKCRRCGNNECEPEEGVSIWCEKCNITFRSQECYKRHLEKKTLKAFPYCDVYEKCKNCRTIHTRESYSKVKHECFSTYLCKICQTRAGEDHQCVHVKPSEKDRNKQMMIRHLEMQEANTTVNKMVMKRGSNILDGIETVIEKKRLHPVMDKGNFASDGSLLPFGLLDSSTSIKDDYMH